MGQKATSADPALDFEAFHRARMIKEAADAVYADRLAGAVISGQEDGLSVRQIADALGVSKSTVARQAVFDHPEARALARDVPFYRTLHQVAWEHYPPAQT